MEITVKLARKSDGSVDVNGSLAAFESALHKHIAERETELATAASAVNAVFDAHKGVRLNMPFIESAALQQLNAQPSNFKTLGKLCLDYVRENAGEGKLFLIGKGKGGGVIRLADQPKAEAKPEAKPETK